MDISIDRIERPADQGGNEQVEAKRIVIGTDDFGSISPFLRLSEDWFRAPGGFGPHPHRGMQTVTLVLDGALEHHDHTGAHGVLDAGDAQWMTAGRGVVHSEKPHGALPVHTLQLWLNLPAGQKMIPPRYVDQPMARAPLVRSEGVEARLYAGALGQARVAHGSDWPMLMIDATIEAGATFEAPVPAGWRGFVYMLEGAARLGAQGVETPAPLIAWFEPAGSPGGPDNTLRLGAQERARCLIVAGPPIEGERVVAYGPFVMNSEDEIRQAFEDYQAGRLAH